MESFLWRVVVSGNGTTTVFLEGLLVPSNVCDKIEIFGLIESRKPRGNTDDACGQESLSLV